MEKHKEIKYDLKNSRNKLKLRENCYGEIAQKKNRWVFVLLDMVSN
jgi:hypothetical protein